MRTDKNIGYGSNAYEMNLTLEKHPEILGPVDNYLDLFRLSWYPCPNDRRDRAASTAGRSRPMTSDRSRLADRMWHRIESLCPGKVGGPGGTAADNRLFVEAVLWHVRTGSPWRDLPPRFGKWNSVFRRWARKGVFETIFKALSEEFDLEYVGIDGTIVTAPAKAAGAPSGAGPVGGPSPRGSAAPGVV